MSALFTLLRLKLSHALLASAVLRARWEAQLLRTVLGAHLETLARVGDGDRCVLYGYRDQIDALAAHAMPNVPPALRVVWLNPMPRAEVGAVMCKRAQLAHALESAGRARDAERVRNPAALGPAPPGARLLVGALGSGLELSWSRGAAAT